VLTDAGSAQPRPSSGPEVSGGRLTGELGVGADLQKETQEVRVGFRYYLNMVHDPARRFVFPVET
jgi:hypothetical protein